MSGTCVLLVPTTSVMVAKAHNEDQFAILPVVTEETESNQSAASRADGRKSRDRHWLLPLNRENSTCLDRTAENKILSAQAVEYDIPEKGKQNGDSSKYCVTFPRLNVASPHTCTYNNNNDYY